METTCYAPTYHPIHPKMPHSTRQSIPLHLYMHMPYTLVPEDHELAHNRIDHLSLPVHNIPRSAHCHNHCQYGYCAKRDIIHGESILRLPKDHSPTDSVRHHRIPHLRISMDCHHCERANLPRGENMHRVLEPVPLLVPTCVICLSILEYSVVVFHVPLVVRIGMPRQYQFRIEIGQDICNSREIPCRKNGSSLVRCGMATHQE
mmetsp:Transcript_20381/g.31922  ORF Transcript_20381/g.31922 Transcript_20381/m.31922 type:complete len:204 (-) Transcript_20381:1297-1908(-)